MIQSIGKKVKLIFLCTRGTYIDTTNIPPKIKLATKPRSLFRINLFRVLRVFQFKGPVLFRHYYKFNAKTQFLYT